MRIIVTGVNGFLGSHMAQYLSDQSHQVIGCARRLREKKPADLHDYADCDLTDRFQTEAFFHFYKPVDCLYHFAAEVGRSDTITKSSCDQNILINTATFAAAHATSIPKILFSSSVNVYDQTSEYGRERLVSEKLARGLCPEAQVHIVRLANVVGRGCPWKGTKARVVASLCRQALVNNGYITIKGNGKQRRAFIHITDAVRAMSIITQHANPKDILDLAIPEIFTVNDIVSCIETIHGPLERRYKPNSMPEPTLDLDGRVHLFRRATDKITWYPGMPLTAAIQDTYEWVRDSIIETGQTRASR